MIFLLSPARTGGPRCSMLLRSPTPIGVALRGRGAEIGDVFSWLSALYFRGKLAYARRFGRGLVIAPGLGLVKPEHRLTADDVRAMAEIDIASAAFSEPLRRDAKKLRGPVVLLGSIATGKYADALLEVLGDRLLFPDCFVGRGDMSRGGLMLRASRSGEELSYIPVAGATRRGTRPPRLIRLR